MSGVMNPLATPLGVINRRSPPIRTLILPSFDAVYPRAYIRRPTSTMSLRSELSVDIPLSRYARTPRAPLRRRSVRLSIVRFAAYSVGITTFGRTEEGAATAVGQHDSALGEDKRATDGIAN